MADIREEARAEADWQDCRMRLGTSGPNDLVAIARRYFMEGRAYGADARKVEGDPREFAHIACDCVPDLGPEHCHLCGERGGKGPVPWSECESRKVEVAESHDHARDVRAWIDKTLALPMYQNSISEYGQGVVETLRSVRTLLDGGMHSDTRAALGGEQS